MIEKTIAWIDRVFTATERVIHAALKLSVVAIILVVAYLLFRSIGWVERHLSTKEKLVNQASAPKDTTTVTHITNNHITNITYPAKVEKEAKPDTTLRKQAEKGTIITGEEIAQGELKVQKIDSAGNKTESDYAVKPTDKISEDGKGNVEITPDKKAERKSKLENTWRDVKAFAVGFGAGFVLGKATK